VTVTEIPSSAAPGGLKKKMAKSFEAHIPIRTDGAQRKIAKTKKHRNRGYDCKRDYG